MDVIIEGKITSEEGVDEVLRTCAEIKSVNTPILRINDNTSELQGRIAFSQGGYIIGAKIANTGEMGYDAVRKLLLVSDGNYAILDPLRKHITEVNQSLWIKVDKLVALLPNLPESSEGLVDPHPDRIEASIVRPKTGQIDISGAFAQAAVEDRAAPVDKGPAPVVVDAKSRSRRFNIGAWRVFRAGLVIIAVFALVLSGLLYSHEIVAFAQNLFKH